MVSRTAVAALGLLVSLAVSLALYVLTDSLLVFLFVPFVPIFLGNRDRPEPRPCPVCGFETTDESYDYCPRDGTKLEGPRG